MRERKRERKREREREREKERERERVRVRERERERTQVCLIYIRYAQTHLKANGRPALIRFFHNLWALRTSRNIKMHYKNRSPLQISDSEATVGHNLYTFACQTKEKKRISYI